jgi:hypothetical protein
MNQSIKRTKRTKRAKKNIRNIKVKEQLRTLEYPYYKSIYKLDVNHIYRLVSQLNLAITSKPIRTVKHGVYNKHLIPLKLNNSFKRIIIIQTPWNKNAELNNLTDYFTEPCRIRCKFLNNPSALEYWELNSQSILKTSNNIHDIREKMYHSIRLCNNFRITVALTVIKMLKSTTWLDISAGWGDRLLTAILSKSIKFYCGVDPNSCLHPYYMEMIKAFNKSSSDYVMLEDGFETAKIPNKDYDLVFSSPPFFDLEVYSDASSNSFSKNSSEEEWFNNFLMPSIFKAISYLIPNGYLVLYMGESKKTNYINDMKRLIDNKMARCGSIYYQDSNVIREFFVWQKVDKTIKN